jgi:CO/xanthine dehydrogenase FAD-binding subunit
MPNAIEPHSVSPARLDEALALLDAADGAPWRPIAGGTDLMVQLTGEIGEPPERVLDLWAIDELRGIRMDGAVLAVGALTTYTELRRSADVVEHAPSLAEAAATIGAAQIQNRGTLGGNIANASPAGDTLPVLLALDAEIVLRSRSAERAVAARDFWTGYRTTARRDDELVLGVRIPVVPDRRVRYRKVGTRRAQAISKVVMAVAWRPAGGGTWSDVRVALGSVAATPIRAARTEETLEGARPTRETAEAAAAALMAELAPIDDVRSTADYRRAVAGRVLHRLVREEGGW